MRPHFTWRLRTRLLELGERTMLMGILNVTPDSFSDGGQYADSGSAIARAIELLEEGADIVDVGGESTRPGSRAGQDAAVTTDAEQQRVLPVIREVLRLRPETIISIDTYHAETARAAVEAGAEIVNDVSGGRWDAAMLPTVAKLSCGAVLMHTRGLPDEWRTLPRLGDPVATVKSALADIRRDAMASGIAKERIVLDPGFGFGKSFEENYPLLARFSELAELGCPLLSGTSRKRFIGHTLKCGGEDRPVTGRLFGSLATVTASILSGAHIVRTHDVEATRDAARVADEILRAKS